jgi:hypothetical protein
MTANGQLDHGVGVLADELLGPVAGSVVPLHTVVEPVVLHCKKEQGSSIHTLISYKSLKVSGLMLFSIAANPVIRGKNYAK